MEELGTIERVDLHEVWPNETTDFTPWLEQHISALSDALGMELEIRGREAPVGDFSLDLLAHDLGRDRTAVIENQLTQTDHRHLGQLLTYASGYDASAVIWLAKEMREEHRQVLDWLNQRTDENTDFFGVVVEALRIDGSRPAPNFRLVAFPNEWRKTNVTLGRGGTLSDRAEDYRAFFQALFDELERQKFTGPRKAQPRSFCGFSSGFSGVTYGASFAQRERIRAGLYIDREQQWNKWLFDELHKAKDTLEAELGEELEWERLDHRRASQIAAYGDGTIDDVETLDKTQRWMIQRLFQFKKAFGPKLAELVS